MVKCDPRTPTIDACQPHQEVGLHGMGLNDVWLVKLDQFSDCRNYGKIEQKSFMDDVNLEASSLTGDHEVVFGRFITPTIGGNGDCGAGQRAGRRSSTSG